MKAVWPAVVPAPSIRVCECWPRDGLQSWPTVIGTERKAELIRRVRAAGVREVDVTSLVPPKLLPQFADAEQLLEQLGDCDLHGRVLAPNLKGVERAADLAARFPVVQTVGFPISASEQHNLANVRTTHEERLDEMEKMVAQVHEAGLQALVAVATSYGCPLVGEVPEDTVFAIVERLVDLGVDRMMLSDTTGLADPVTVAAYTQRMRAEHAHVDLIAHFHDTRGTGLVNTWAAVSAGATCVDSCLGGVGGEPATIEQNHAGETGNVSTEDLVVLLERSGISTGVDIDALMAAGRFAEAALGSQGRSQVLRTGPGFGNQPPSAPDSGKGSART